MLMNEVASAADTLELWKMVNDSVWASLQRIQKQEAERKAAQKKAAGKGAASTRGMRYPHVVANQPPQRRPAPVPQPQQLRQLPQQQPQAAQSAATVSSGSQQRLGLQQPKPVAKDSDKP